jgi:hypothetical protein
MHIRSTEPMAVRRADARLRLAAEIDARADRRRSRWLRACHACYAVACLSMLATVGLAFALPVSPAVGVCLRPAGAVPAGRRDRVRKGGTVMTTRRKRHGSIS